MRINSIKLFDEKIMAKNKVSQVLNQIKDNTFIQYFPYRLNGKELANEIIFSSIIYLWDDQTLAEGISLLLFDLNKS